MAKSPKDMPKVRGLSAGYALLHYFYSRWYYKKAVRDNESAPEKPEIIGIRNARGRFKLDSVPTGWANTLDTTSRPGHVKITLTNNSGDAGIVRGYSITGNPVLRFGGNLGYKHDSFNDFDDITKNGERVFEFGNNFIVTKTQLETLADYYWKLMRRKKHMYVITLSGTRYWFEPGEWYTLQVGGAGQVEYIDATVECYDVQTERGADGVGQTVIAFREVEQNWVFDSNAVARFIACGSPQAIPKTEGVVSVASSDYLGAADFYCDGTEDEDEINAAITLAGTLDGGEVRLLGGTFNIDDAVNLVSNVFLDMNACTIVATGTGCLTISGTIGTDLEMSGIRNGTITADGIDGNVISSEYADNVFINGVAMSGFNGSGIVLGLGTSNLTIERCIIHDVGLYGINAANIEENISIRNNRIYNCGSNGVSITEIGSIENNHIGDCVGAGIVSSGNDARISNNLVERCGLRRFATMIPGIGVTGDYNLVTTNYAKENGNLISYAQCEDDSNPPQIDGNTASNTSAARSNTVAYAGTYSYKITKTVAAGTEAYYLFTDNFDTSDQHGFIDGLSYRVSCRVYVPSTGGPAAAEVSIRAYHYTGGWTTVTDAADAQDEWQELTLDVTMGGSMTGASAGMHIASTAADTEFIYIDNVRVVPLGLGNDHDNNFYDLGTGTVVSGNSWQ